VNGSTFGSALSYIPEVPWNDSCAGGLLVDYLGFNTAYGPDSFCATVNAREEGFRTTASGSGGPSGCASGAPFNFGTVGGTCKGYAKPAWQSGVIGIPNDGVRDIPDLSLFAANGLWGHYYVFCWTDTGNGGAPCLGAPSGWSGAGGTSFSSPILAGIQALVNQKQGRAQGNPNYVYYKLAAHEYGAQGSSNCNSSSSPSSASAGCIFHDVTFGDIAVNCAGPANCFGAIPNQPGHYLGVADGALSISNSSYAPAFGAVTGWDFATGIGTVDAYNLVMNWTY
jgi:subtilase family serine protease